MSSTSTINAIAPIVGVVIGALLAGVFNYFNNKSHVRLIELTEQKKLNISRVEEAYEILDSLGDYASSLVFELAVSIKEQRPMSSDGINRVSTDRLNLLSSLYFEKLTDDTELLKEHFSTLTRVIMRFYLDKNMPDEAAKKSLSEAKEILDQINTLALGMKEKLINESKEINQVV